MRNICFLLLTGLLTSAVLAHPSTRLFAADRKGVGPIGTVRLDASSHLTIEKVVPAQRAWLGNVCSWVNKLKRMDPPTPGGALVERGDKRFLPGLRRYLQGSYGLSLRPGEPSTLQHR